MLCLSFEEKIMKRLLILTCVGSLAFALAAGAADQSNNNPPKKGKGGKAVAVPKGQTNVHANTQVHSQHFNSTAPFHTHSANQADLTVHHNTLNTHVANQTNVGVHNQMSVHRQHANVTITNNWNGQQFSNQRYAAFRNYHRQFHDRDWYRHNHSRIVFYFGAPYFWDNGYWEPAWGYNPGFTYDYDGPIYGYNGLAPDQVLITVQTRLQQQGYYQGAVDGTMGPLTRQALADFQADHGLAVTAAVDEPTIETLGMG
jgi:hypothetical protein